MRPGRGWNGTFPHRCNEKCLSWTTSFHLVPPSSGTDFSLQRRRKVPSVPPLFLCSYTVDYTYRERESLRESLSRTSYPPPTPPSIGGMSGGEAERERGCPRRALFVAMTPFHSVLRGGTGVERDRGRRALFVATARESPGAPILPLDASRSTSGPSSWAFPHLRPATAADAPAGWTATPLSPEQPPTGCAPYRRPGRQMSE